VDSDYKRLNRLTAILHLLQAKRLVTAPFMAEKFGVSIRTIYRDVRSLEQSGVPVISEEGKGYSLLEGYRLPPVMFTEREAMALITAEQFLLGSKDTSLSREFSEAMLKIKAVLSHSNKSAMELLSKRVFISKNFHLKPSGHRLMEVQAALTQSKLMEIEYADEKGESSKRTIEPFLLYNNAAEEWVLVAFCRLRSDFRHFRLDRIQKTTTLDTRFTPQPMTVEQYLKKYEFPPYNP